MNKATESPTIVMVKKEEIEKEFSTKGQEMSKYIGHVKNITANNAMKITCPNEKQLVKERDLIRRAAKSLKIEVKTRKVGKDKNILLVQLQENG